MKRIIIFLIFFFIVLFIWGEKLATFDNVYKPRSFQIDGDDLYIVDQSVIKHFSMKDFRFIRQIGKKGEGPGEFKWAPQIQIFPDHIFAASSGKVTFFSRKGDMIKEIKLPGRFRINKVKGSYLKTKFDIDIKKVTAKVFLEVLDNKFKTKKEICTYNYPPGSFKVFSSGIKKKLKLNMIRDYFNAITDGNNIFIGNTIKGFYFEIYDHEGNKVNTIRKDYEKVKVLEEFKKKRMDELKRSKNWERDKKMFDHVFPEYFPAFEKFKVNNGKIYVFKHIIKEKEREILVLDLKGKVLKKTFVPDEKYYNICNNKYYYFIDNEDEELMEFHVIDL